MRSNTPAIFFFGDAVVGQFSNGTFPQTDGDVTYAPFRGPGHLQMQTTLKQNGSVECYFKLDERRVSFRVIECPGYGVLRIRELAGAN
jgi:hypothetical protein